MSQELIQLTSDLPPESPIRQQIVVAQIMAKSKMVPQHFWNKPEDLLVAIMAGEPLGLSAFHSAKAFAVIQGTPSLYGDALIAVCQRDPDYEWHTVDYDEETKTATATVKRKNAEPTSYDYSWQSATRAGVTSRSVWKSHPIKMLMNRALAHLLRMQFARALFGIESAEEIEDHAYATTGTEIKPAEVVVDALPPVDWAEKISRSVNLDELQQVGDDLANVDLPHDQRSHLIEIYINKKTTLEEKD